MMAWGAYSRTTETILKTEDGRLYIYTDEEVARVAWPDTLVVIYPVDIGEIFDKEEEG